MPDWFKDVAKAINGAILSALFAAATALVGDNTITKYEWVLIGIALFGGGYGVWQTPDSMSPLRKALKNSRT